mgnify:CR=1 FL=1
MAYEEEHGMSIGEAVNMVSRNYENLNDMLQACSRTSDPDVRALLELSVLVHVYLKVGKPQDIKDKIEEIWNGLRQ